MSWLSQFLGPAAAASKAQPSPSDPFNFLMDQYLHHNPADEAALLGRALPQFPGLTPEAAQLVLQEVVRVYHFTVARQYDARDGLLPLAQVEPLVRAQAPPLTEATLQGLLTQTRIGAYR